jgi:hypothetical protein
MLFKCPEDDCDEMIAEDTSSCPNCGAPDAGERARRIWELEVVQELADQVALKGAVGRHKKKRPPMGNIDDQG